MHPYDQMIQSQIPAVQSLPLVVYPNLDQYAKAVMALAEDLINAGFCADKEEALKMALHVAASHQGQKR